MRILASSFLSKNFPCNLVMMVHGRRSKVSMSSRFRKYLRRQLRTWRGQPGRWRWQTRSSISELFSASMFSAFYTVLAPPVINWLAVRSQVNSPSFHRPPDTTINKNAIRTEGCLSRMVTGRVFIINMLHPPLLKKHQGLIILYYNNIIWIFLCLYTCIK